MSVSDKNWIVITSIFPPTEAVQRFSRRAGWRLVVAGDRKSPAEWRCGGATFLSAAQQEASGYKVARALPWNHYCRKMVGYVHAIRGGAEVIVDTDDDNLPKEDWAFPPFEGEFLTSAEDRGFQNVYSLYTSQRIWPRGFPLEKLTDPSSTPRWSDFQSRAARLGIWQGLADGDPDVDAIYRLIDNSPCNFDVRPPIVLGRGTLCPFNSQNTAYQRELFPLLYLPAFVTFRFTDILRGLVAQPILWLHGWRLGFTKATVVQERNPHNYLKDFESEIPCYLKVAEVVQLVREAARAGASITDNLHAAYAALIRARIVPEQELPLLEAWIEDVGG